MGFKFKNTKIYIVPGTSHKFRTEHDARYYCQQHSIDFSLVEKYDSTKEYDRWIALLKEQQDGLISDLRRQVVYEIIPAHTERIKSRNKVVKDWVVENEHFRTQKEAHAYCKAHGLQYASAYCIKTVEPVYKNVVIEQNAEYTADFVYRNKSGELIVEDVKSDATRKEKDYVLRRKLMLYVHGIRILET